ncbi:MAG: hypothetical protein WCS09_06285 [Pseudomonadota bacterium]
MSILASKLFLPRLALVASQVSVLLVGFAGGIYALPILIAPDPVPAQQVQAHAAAAKHQGRPRPPWN